MSCSTLGTPLGTHERFIGFLIQHYAGNFPLWLAPDQVRVITLNDDEALINYAQPVVAELRANMVRVDADFSATPFKAEIATAERGGSFPPHIVGCASSRWSWDRPVRFHRSRRLGFLGQVPSRVISF